MIHIKGLLNIEQFIKDNKCMQVTSTRMYTKGTTFDPQGLWSETIFGMPGTNDRKTRYGYIDLGCYIVHPSLYSLLYKQHSSIAQFLNLKDPSKLINKFVNKNDLDKITKLNNIEINSLEDLSGPYGLYLLRSSIKWEEIISDEDLLNKIIKKDKLFISKWLVCPAAYRDVVYSGKKQIVQKAEINNLYIRILNASQIVFNMPNISDKCRISNTIQEVVNKSYMWLLKNVGGAHGLMRHAMLRKTVDFSGRFVLTPDPNIGTGEIGIAWYYLMKLFEPLILHHLKDNDNIKEILLKVANIDIPVDKVSVETLQKIIRTIAAHPEIVKNISIKEALKEFVSNIVKDKYVCIKRDPVLDKGHWIGLRIVPTDDPTAKLNPTSFSRIGGDCDGDSVDCNVSIRIKYNTKTKILDLPIRNLFSLKIKDIK